MYKKQILFLLLALATMACGLLSFGNEEAPAPKAGEAMEAAAIEEEAGPPEASIEEEPATDAEQPAADAAAEAEIELPYPEEAKYVNESTDLLTFKTVLTFEEVVGFYRRELTAMGYTEKEEYTKIGETKFSVVFDPPGEGKRIKVQGTDMGDDNSLGKTSVHVLLQRRP